MAFDLRMEVEELRKRGESLGLNHDDIDYAILKALGEESKPEEEKNQRKKPKNNLLAICKYIFVAMAAITCLLMVVISGVYIASEHNKKFGLLVGRTLADWQYPIVRFFRLVTLPLHHYTNMHSMYSWECIVKNPSYTPMSPECEICEKARRVPIRSSELLPQLDFKKKYFDPGFSVIVRNVGTYGTRNHTFEEFLEMYYENQAIMDQDACEFYTGDVNATGIKLKELLENWDHYEPQGHVIGWKFCYGKGFRRIRKLYPRPYFVHTEGALEKTMQLLQPAGTTPETVELPRESFDNIWYAQVAGSTQVELSPVEDCKGICKTHRITLIKGDVLFFTQQVLKASFTNIEQKPAIIFVSSFA